MTATGHTEYYNLSQYTDDDHPTYTGDYNEDMRKIDAAIHAASQSGSLEGLTSRIAALESQVAALTGAAAPSTTGLTAKELDTQYSDGYNIVRVGTPTRSTKTEESSHE